MDRIFTLPHHPMPYGTAGFRAKAVTLERVMGWCGIVAGLRAQHKGTATGVMVTASHNPEEDNGAKIVDTNGGMLDQSWEPLATRLVASGSRGEAEKEVEAIRAQFPPQQQQQQHVSVMVACDTRKSSPSLTAEVLEGIRYIGANAVNLGVLTTPQLHFAVYRHNLGLTYDESSYYTWFADALVKAVGNDVSLPDIVVDGANGVGGSKFGHLVDAINQRGIKWNVTVVNKPGDGGLNDGAGAEHVQKTKTPPHSITPGTLAANRYASFDGDADRLVLFFFGQEGGLILLDGDKIAALLGGFIQRLVREAALDLRVEIIQTAYANGASTKYMREKLGVTVSMAKTGVKHLHAKAEHADIGVYFEANGHGTVIFSDKSRSAISAAAASGSNASAVKLDGLVNLINPAVGDAMADLLAVEAVLHLSGMTLQQWSGMYTDLPSTMTKEMVPDRYKFIPNDDETRILSPPSLQEAIDTLVTAVGGGRAFVRPSGTEDCVRVYAEADDECAAVQLAKDVGVAVQQFSN